MYIRDHVHAVSDQKFLKQFWLLLLYFFFCIICVNVKISSNGKSDKLWENSEKIVGISSMKSSAKAG